MGSIKRFITTLMSGPILVVALAVLPSSTLLAVPLDGSAGLGQARLGQEVVCVPPGLPPFSEWSGGPAKGVIVQDERGRPVVAVDRYYVVRGQKFYTIWVGRILVSVDPAPDDPKELGWHDGGAVTPSTLLRDEPKQACQWFRLPSGGRAP